MSRTIRLSPHALALAVVLGGSTSCMSDLSVGMSEALPEDDLGADPTGRPRDAGRRDGGRDAGFSWTDDGDAPWLTDGGPWVQQPSCDPEECDEQSTLEPCSVQPTCERDFDDLCRWHCNEVISREPVRPDDGNGDPTRMPSEPTAPGLKPMTPSGAAPGAVPAPETPDPSKPAGTDGTAVTPANPGVTQATPEDPTDDPAGTSSARPEVNPLSDPTAPTAPTTPAPPQAPSANPPQPPSLTPPDSGGRSRAGVTSSGVGPERSSAADDGDPQEQAPDGGTPSTAADAGAPDAAADAATSDAG